MFLCEVDTLECETHYNPFQFFIHLPYFLMLIVKIEIILRFPEETWIVCPFGSQSH